MSKNYNGNKKDTTGKKRTISKMTLIAGFLLFALVIGLGFSAIKSRHTTQMTAESTEAENTEAAMKPHMEGAQDFLNEDNAGAENEEDSENDSEVSEKAEPDENGIEPGYSPSGEWLPMPTPDPDQAPKSETIELVTPAPLPTIFFPYAIPGTDLVVQQISPYSGYYLEDGSDRSVDNIAAIVVTNNGEALDFVGIGIAQGLTSLAFSGSQIPAHSTVIIQEQTGAMFPSGEYNTCTATMTASTGMQTSSDDIVITDNGNNTFTVANISEKTIPEVTVYFKNYLPDEDVYVGGITYHITLEDIEPDTGVEVNSGHYASGYSVIVDMDITK